MVRSDIKVLNLKNHVPTANDIYIGRGSPLGNPFTHIPIKNTKAQFQTDTRKEAIEKCEQYLLDELSKGNASIRNALNEIYKKAKVGPVNLMCYCTPQACHGSIIKKMIEAKL